MVSTLTIIGLAILYFVIGILSSIVFRIYMGDPYDDAADLFIWFWPFVFIVCAFCFVTNCCEKIAEIICEKFCDKIDEEERIDDD